METPPDVGCFFAELYKKEMRFLRGELWLVLQDRINI